jgi:hypothetical protein
MKPGISLRRPGIRARRQIYRSLSFLFSSPSSSPGMGSVPSPHLDPNYLVQLPRRNDGIESRAFRVGVFLDAT